MISKVLTLLLIFSFVMAKSKPFIIKGDQLGESIAAFSTRHLDADCYIETGTTQICEQNKVLIYNRYAWVRSVFTQEHLTYLSFSINGNQKEAERILLLMTKDFGVPDDSNVVTGITDNLTVWYNKDDNLYKDNKLSLTFSSADTNNLGHGVIRIWLEKVNR